MSSARCFIDEVQLGAEKNYIIVFLYVLNGGQSIEDGAAESVLAYT